MSRDKVREQELAQAISTMANKIEVMCKAYVTDIEKMAHDGDSLSRTIMVLVSSLDEGDKLANVYNLFTVLKTWERKVKKIRGPNCEECSYRGSVAGSAHICCQHPLIGEPNPIEKMMGIFASVGRAPPILNVQPLLLLNIAGDPHGIKKGWFNWPYDFDPTWLLSCDGFKLSRKIEITDGV